MPGIAWHPRALPPSGTCRCCHTRISPSLNQPPKAHQPARLCSHMADVRWCQHGVPWADECESMPNCCHAMHRTRICTWQAGKAERTATADRRVQVWDHGGNGCVRYSAATVGLPVMGYVAENRVIQAALGQRLRSRSSVVDYLSPASSFTALCAHLWSVSLFQCVVCHAAT